MFLYVIARDRDSHKRCYYRRYQARCCIKIVSSGNLEYSSCVLSNQLASHIQGRRQGDINRCRNRCAQARWKMRFVPLSRGAQIKIIHWLRSRFRRLYYYLESYHRRQKEIARVVYVKTNASSCEKLLEDVNLIRDYILVNWIFVRLFVKVAHPAWWK